MSMLNRTKNEEGWVLVTSIVLLGIMLAIGLALLSVADTQSQASGKQRQGDSAFNYAEGALNSTAFLLSRSWPDDASLTPNGTTAVCGSQSLTGTIGTTAGATLADRIQNQLTQSFGSSGSSDYPTARTSWKVNICDDTPGSTAWSDTTMTTAAAWDANGALTVTATDPTSGQPYTYKVRRLWIRAQATVSGRTRAVVGLVQVPVKPALPSRYAALAGGFSSDLMTGVNSLLTGSTLTPVTTLLLSQHKLYAGDTTVPGGGKLGIRCGLLSTPPCVTGGAFAALSTTNLGALLLANDVVQYGSPTAVSNAVLDGFRRDAKLKGYYHATEAAGTPCIPSSDTSPAGKTVFVENVGSGDDSCTISSSVAAKMLVVVNGRVKITGPATTPTAGSPATTFSGVIYDAFAQGNRSPAPSAEKVVSMTGYSSVLGAVYIDGSGKLDVQPPPFDTSALIDSLPLCNGLLTLACNLLKAPLRALGVDALLNQLVSLVGLSSVVNGLTAQLSGYGPAVQESKAAVDGITTYGSSGTVAGTFRQIPRN